MKKIGEERKSILQEFDQKAQELLELLERIQHRFVNIDGVRKCLTETRESLELSDFLGCVRKMPAAKQMKGARVDRRTGLLINMAIAGSADCINPKVGDIGYRVTIIWPQKTVKVVYYHGFGWLTDEEWADLRQREPRLAP